MDLGNNDDAVDIDRIDAESINRIKLLDSVKDTKRRIVRVTEYFFKQGYQGDSAPFKGFLLEGPPGTGKTEAVRQSVRDLGQRVNTADVKMVFVDGASIAAPKWGEAENTLRNVFRQAEELSSKGVSEPKVVVLFDDIESLMIGRGAGMAKEWHYSINSVLFHEVDRLDPNNTIICATTNRPDLVDDAIHSRLYPIEVSGPAFEELMEMVERQVGNSVRDDITRDKLVEAIRERLEKMESPTIRDAQQAVVVECIESGAWS